MRVSLLEKTGIQFVRETIEFKSEDLKQRKLFFEEYVSERSLLPQARPLLYLPNALDSHGGDYYVVSELVQWGVIGDGFVEEPSTEKIEQLKKKYNPSNEIIKENEDLIIENNDNFVVLNKQSGISVQGGTKSKKNIIDIFAKSNFFKDEKPYSVHRLDKDTSGVFIIAKNRETAQLLTSLFRLRKVYKTYLAICNGELILIDKE